MGERQHEQLQQDAKAARVDAERRAEEKHLAQQRERKAVVASFLEEHGFQGINSQKKKLLKTSYPIHKAAKVGNAQLVQMLLMEGADPDQKNSRGETAAEVAQKKNSGGSHASVVRVLVGSLPP